MKKQTFHPLKDRPKLKLNRETLRVLGTTHLQAIAAGLTSGSTYRCHSGATCIC